MGSLRRECLDHTLILHGKHLQRVVKEYTNYFNQERPHQGIGQQIPDFYDQPDVKPDWEDLHPGLSLGVYITAIPAVPYLN